MKKRNRKHPVKQRKVSSVFILVMMVIAVFLTFYAKEVQEHVVLTAPVSDHTPVSDREWNLTLVNKWNGIPDQYEIDLVKVPGGEKVDTRIYEPLMEMLEDAKEENWNQL